MVSRRTRWGAAAGGAVALMIVMFVALPMVLRHQSAPADAPPVSNMPSAQGKSTELYDTRRVDDIIKLQSGALDLRLQSRGETTR